MWEGGTLCLEARRRGGREGGAPPTDAYGSPLRPQQGMGAVLERGGGSPGRGGRPTGSRFLLFTAWVLDPFIRARIEGGDLLGAVVSARARNLVEVPGFKEVQCPGCPGPELELGMGGLRFGLLLDVLYPF